MERLRVYSHRKAKLVGGMFIAVLILLGVRVGYLMVFQANHYAALAEDVEQRERKVKGGTRPYYRPEWNRSCVKQNSVYDFCDT